MASVRIPVEAMWMLRCSPVTNASVLKDAVSLSIVSCPGAARPHRSPACSAETGLESGEREGGRQHILNLPNNGFSNSSHVKSLFWFRTVSIG